MTMHRYANTARSSKPVRSQTKYLVGARARVHYVPHGSGFYREERVEIVGRAVRRYAHSNSAMTADRYLVRTLRDHGPQVEGWLYGSDLTKDEQV